MDWHKKTQTMAREMNAGPHQDIHDDRTAIELTEI